MTPHISTYTIYTFLMTPHISTYTIYVFLMTYTISTHYICFPNDTTYKYIHYI